MGFALIWIEGLAVALLSLALAIAWAARGRATRWIWTTIVFLLFFLPGAFVTLWGWETLLRDLELVRTSWFYYSLTWLLAYVLLGASWRRRGLRRPEPGMARSAAAWPRDKLWLGLGGAVLAFGLTFWNMDLSARADLAIARQEAGALLLGMTPPPVSEAENAARVYADAVRDLGQPIEEPWRNTAFRGLDAQEPADWKAPYLAELLQRHAAVLPRLREAAVMPRCNFDRRPTLLDAADKITSAPIEMRLRRGAMLLAIDARMRAMEGDIARAFEDIGAIFGMVRHVAGQFRHLWGMEAMAWRTLEEVLRLAPPAKKPLPALASGELPPLIRLVCEEQAFLGMIFPTLATDPSHVIAEIRKHDGSLVAGAVENVGVPIGRVFILSDELAAMHELFARYQKAPRSARDETPKDWAELRNFTETARTSILSVYYIKPKQRVVFSDGWTLAGLRGTGRTALAVAAYYRKHGRYPERVEQLVPEFLPAVPVDPRDGQVLRISSVAGEVAIYAPQDAAGVESGKLRDPLRRWSAPIFRLMLQGPAK